MRKTLLGLALVAFAATRASAGADNLSTSGSLQAAGLFRMACLDNAGDSAGVRAFLDGHGLQRFPAEASKAFLQSRRGVAYNATAKDIRLAVSSEDDGACTVFADHADARVLASTLEELWQRLGIRYVLIRDHDDESMKTLHHRAYHLKIGERIFLTVMTTDAAPGKIQAFITLSSRAPSDVVQQDQTLN